MNTWQVIGLQRSGTFYLQWIIENCFKLPVMWDNLKHDLPSEIPTRDFMHSILIYKDFDHWEQSIRRMPANFFGMRGEDMDLKLFYNKFLAEWKPYVPFVRYEDFLLDYKSALDNLAGILGKKPENYDKPEILPMSLDWKPEHIARYV